MGRKLSNEKIQYIIDNYNKEKNNNIAEKLNVSRHIVWRYAKDHGLKLKEQKKYNHDEDFFEKIDNEIKSYWLGFLYADGFVRERKVSSEMKLKLSVKDLEHLNKFRNDIKTDSIIRYYNDNKICFLSINSRKIVRDLINNGCVNKKSKIIKFPYFLNEKLRRHFIRGYFDGDGCVYSSISKKSVSIVSGSFDMLNSLKIEITKNTNTVEPTINDHRNYKTSGDFGYINWYGIESIAKIYNYFYSDSTICLNRKKEKFEEILNDVKNK